MYEQAITDICAAVETARSGTASTWAEILASVDSDDPLCVLLGDVKVTDHNVESRCRTKRARNLLRANGLSRLDRLTALSIREVWALRGCGRQSAIDILAAALMTLVDNQPVPVGADVPLPGMGVEMELSERIEPRGNEINRTSVSDPLLHLLKGR
ncbi:hypothetical protein [Nocardia brasiliensis]|uniref:hypothetical protein n=1 Tax=Nocardia brasiliensis TaxID=37326 RepID=UPI00114CFF0E|nr:hypothetical protein [Nocardia brasiliensis]